MHRITTFPVPGTATFNGIALNANGELFIQWASGTTTTIQKVDPGNGNILSPANGTTINFTGGGSGSGNGVDMAACSTPPSLELEKSVDNRQADTDQFTLSITGGNVAPGPSNPVTTVNPPTGAANGVQTPGAGPVIVRPGMSYTFTETGAGTPTNLNNYTTTFGCVNQGANPTVVVPPTPVQSTDGGTSISFVLPAPHPQAGEAILCRFTNTAKLGAITIIKRTNPRGLPQAFNFTAAPALGGTCTQPAASFTLNDANNMTADNTANTQACTSVPLGTYTVTEPGTPGFSLEDLECEDGGIGGGVSNRDTGTATITLTQADQHVTCTYVNEQLTGGITIIKRTDPRGVPQDFHFTASPALGGTCTQDDRASFTLHDADSTTRADSDANRQVCTDVPVGTTYTVTETGPPDGFSREDLECNSVGTTPGGSAMTNLAAGTATITLTDASQHIECVYTNLQLAPALVQNKTVSPTGTVSPGAELTYTVTVQNTGTAAAHNVVATDTLPTQVTWVSNAPSLGTATPPVGGLITWNIGTINPNQTVTLDITVTVN
jgi:uncharacterized repeat protein (TIGR01451 family)